MDDWAIPIASLLILMASQLFWLRRVIDLGERFIPGKWGRAGLRAVVFATWLFFFAANLVPWESVNGNGTHASTTLTLRNVLLEAPFQWWVVGSLAGLGLVIIFWMVDRATRVVAWLYRRVCQVAAGYIPAPKPGVLALDPPSPARRRFLEQSAVAVSAAPFVAGALGFSTGGST